MDSVNWRFIYSAGILVGVLAVVLANKIVGGIWIPLRDKPSLRIKNQRK